MILLKEKLDDLYGVLREEGSELGSRGM